MSYNDVRKGVNQAEYNEIAIGYFGITSLGIGYALYKYTDMWAVGVIYFFVAAFIMQTSFAKYFSGIYAILWAYFVGSIAYESQGIVLAVIVAGIALVITYNLGLGTEEYYSDITDYEEDYYYEDDNSHIDQDYLFYDDLEDIKIALSNGHDIDTKDDKGMTPLMYHTWMGRTKIAKFLYFEGADASIKNDEGKTALDIANDENNKVLIKLLN
jgi:hypothetical protein